MSKILDKMWQQDRKRRHKHNLSEISKQSSTNFKQQGIKAEKIVACNPDWVEESVLQFVKDRLPSKMKNEEDETSVIKPKWKVDIKIPK